VRLADDPGLQLTIGVESEGEGVVEVAPSGAGERVGDEAAGGEGRVVVEMGKDEVEKLRR
jgi:hypothetical protein